MIENCTRGLWLDHGVLRVTDLDRDIRFYRDVLGLQVAKSHEPLGLFHLRAGASLIDLVAFNWPLGKPGGGPPWP